MKKESRTKLSIDKDQRPEEVNPYLRLSENRKKWYHQETMGKQRGKPRYDMAGMKNKKEKGHKPLTKVFKKP